jgi:hypothetical protein
VEGAVVQAMEANTDRGMMLPPRPNYSLNMGNMGSTGNAGSLTRGITGVGNGGNGENGGNGGNGGAEAGLQRWMQLLLPPTLTIRRPLDYSYAFPHSPQAGVLVEIERLYNMPEIGGYSLLFGTSCAVYKVIASTSPPGLFYKDPPLLDGVYYTKTQSLESHVKSPIFEDGFVEFTPPNMGVGLYLVLDVRRVRVEGQGGDTPSVDLDRKGACWTLLPLSMGMWDMGGVGGMGGMGMGAGMGGMGGMGMGEDCIYCFVSDSTQQAIYNIMLLTQVK